jgi:predicted DNA-binding ribbon-helix-helix protein
MGKNVSTAVVSFRLTHDEIEDLKKIAEDRDLKVNAILRRMVSRRIREIRKEEGW